MTIRARAFAGPLFTLTLALALGSGLLTLYVQQEDAVRIADAARTTLHADLAAAPVEHHHARPHPILIGRFGLSRQCGYRKPHRAGQPKAEKYQVAVFMSFNTSECQFPIT